MSGGVDYFTHCSTTGAHDLYVGEEEAQQGATLTDLISQRSADYVRRHGDDARRASRSS